MSITDEVLIISPNNKIQLIGVQPETNRISAFWRIFDRAMGLFCTSERLYLSSKYQLWQLDNVLAEGGQHQGYDRHSCKPLWKPGFISQYINEDRWHLNCLAMVEGKRNMSQRRVSRMWWMAGAIGEKVAERLGARIRSGVRSQLLSILIAQKSTVATIFANSMRK